jgi:hypothetical protein
MSTPNILSASTHQQYLKRAESLIQRFIKSTSSEQASVDLNEFLVWQDAQKQTLSPATRRLYRAALACYFNHHNLYDLLTDRPSFMQCSIPKTQIQSLKGKRTAALKNKKINWQSWSLLTEYFDRSRSTYAPLTQDIINASMMLGLRPIEWSQCELLTHDVASYSHEPMFSVQIINAKSTQGRSFGQYRILHFGSMAEDAACEEAIELAKIVTRITGYFETFRQALSIANLEQLEQHENQTRYRSAVDALIRRMTQFLNQAFRTDPTLKTVPKNKRITLYSARHQFAANQKKTGQGDVELAAMMGHGSRHTSEQHYGRKRSGVRGAAKVQADASCVEAVMSKMRTCSKVAQPLCS